MKLTDGCLGSLIFAPIGCVRKLFFVAGVVMVFVLLAMQAVVRDDGAPGGSGVKPGPPGDLAKGEWKFGPRFSRVEHALPQYPLLNQLDSGIYDPLSLASQFDPETRAEVRHIACLATVYLMVERGRGKADAKLTRSSFDRNFYALGRPDVTTRSEAFDGQFVIQEIRAGRPVILHGVGGRFGNHYMLAVKITPKGNAGYTIVAHDPWEGQSIRLEADVPAQFHPTLRGLWINQMRRVQ